MLAKFKTGRAQFIAILGVALLTLYQVIRVVAFVNVYGGVEHDGGWLLSISRSLAEQGTYTTMVSTIVDPNVPGAPNVDQKFDIQTLDGRIWFFTGNATGPTSIVPDALILKLFGTDFWALRAGPLIFYLLFLILATVIVYQLAGLGAVVLFHAFLFFYPHLSIFLAYEAMGEVPSMFYILGAYLAFAAVIKTTADRRWPRFFIAGLIAGFALATKLITLWSISGIYIWAGFLWLVGLAGGKKIRLSELLALVSGVALPLALWELVQLAVLTRLVGFELYLRHTGQRLKFILDDGSGLGSRLYSGSEFFWDKFFLLTEVAHPRRWVTMVIFFAILAGGLALLWLWRRQPQKQNLLAPMWFGWLVNVAWFVSLAKTGWPRHFWFGMILAVMLLCVISVVLVRLGVKTYRRDGAVRNFVLSSLPTGILLLILIGWGFISQPHVWGFFLPDEIVPYWREKQINNKYDASLPWIIIPRAYQIDVINYIKQMPIEAKVYFPDARKSAEIPPQTGRIQYPLNRRNHVAPHPADVVLIGPALISPWKDPIQRRDLLELIEQECPRPAIKNDFYMICPIIDNLPQQ